MQVSKWGNSLGIRLPKALIEAMGLRAGDELNLVKAGDKAIALAKSDPGDQFLKAIAAFNWPAPADDRFDRDAANER